MHARTFWTLIPLLGTALAIWTAQSIAQHGNGNPDMAPTNDLPNPFSDRVVMPLPDGRSWGSTAGVDAAKGRDDIWAIDRCGSNGCVGSHVDPLMHYDANGDLIGQMGADLFAFPHGIHIDADDRLFVADSESRDGADNGMDLAHPGWQRGIRIGSARDGIVRYFIPDPDPAGGSSAAEGVAAVRGGAVVYGAEVGPRAFVRYDRR